MNQLLHESNAADQFADLLDLVFERANPNPEREDCPTSLVLRQLAIRELPIGHPGYRHLSRCSPCYRQLRAFQRQRSPARSLPRGR